MRKLENRVSDYFIICMEILIRKLMQLSSVTKKVSKGLREKPWGVEGTEMLMGIIRLCRCSGSCVSKEKEFYDLEGLWGDAKKIELN